jgi:competence protein ComEC
MAKKVYWLILIIVTSGLLFGLYKLNIRINLPSQKPELEVAFLDVGQGDSIYIRTPNNTKILIDGGGNKNIMTELSAVRPFWERDIDIMILTHPHADHLIGLIEVLNRLNVRKVYYTGALSPTPDYIEWLKIICEQNIPLEIIAGKQTLNIDRGINLEFLYPFANFTNIRPKELNDSSIVTRLTYKNINFLFMGDAEVPVEEELLQENIDLRAQVLKVGHHGSTSSSSEAFLERVNPQIAIICVGQDNDFGHPHLQTLRRLERRGISILRTDELGTIRLKTDGQTIKKYKTGIFTKDEILL